MPSSFLYIDILLYTVYALLSVAVASAIWSALHGVITHERSAEPIANRYPSVFAYITPLLVLLILTISYLTASTKPVVSNGQLFTDTLWLRITDMFVITSILLIVLCSVVIVIVKFRR